MDRPRVRAVLAIVAAPHVDGPEATEFLRVLVALRACEVAVELVETADGIGTLSRDPELTPEGERSLEALREDGVVARPVPLSTDLHPKVEAASDVVVLPDPSRTRFPPLVRWADVRDRSDAIASALAAGAFLRS